MIGSGKVCALAVAALCVAAPAPARAEEWSWLRAENTDARDGNQKLKNGDPEGALSAYDSAARELPSQGGVHLNRGLALMQLERGQEAQQAFELAAQPPADKDVRADAYYNLGLMLYRQGDAQAGEEDHEAAQKSFGDAAQALRKSLTLRPGDRDTAWNYELAMRRLREEEEKQEQQEQEQEQEQSDDEEQQEDQEQDDEEQQDQKPSDESEQPDQQQDPQQDGEQKADEQEPDQQEQEPGEQEQEQNQQPQDQQQPQEQPPEREPALPQDVERALDALQDSEKNLERMRALQRAHRERREPEKDW